MSACAKALPVPFVAPLAALGLGFFMVLVDTTVTLVAVPAIGRNLGASPAGLQWAVNAYTLAFASLLLAGGSLADRHGPRRVFLAGIALFCAASAGCAAAPSIEALVAARTLKGIGAALLMPASLALLPRAFPTEPLRGRAYGAWSGIAALALVAGPSLGGPLVELAGWRAVFWINLPFGAAALCLTLRHLPRDRPGRAVGFDLTSQALAVAALAGLAAALIEGSLAAAALGLLASALFLRRQAARAEAAMLPLSLFQAPGFAMPVAIGLLYNFSFYGLQFLLSVVLQESGRLSPAGFGLLLLPLSLSCAVAAFLAAAAMRRWGRRWPIAAGLALAATGAAVIAVALASHAPLSVTGLGAALVGLGGGVMVAPLTATALAAVPEARRGLAAGILNAARQAGGVLGIAIPGAMATAAPLAAGLTALGFASAALLAWRGLPPDHHRG
ncbi:MFS transporter [Roseomonas sp. 18066]|uniref:MFS transporter n=1 Tax=Roseomonas sp. 18066 TaxID=2681412 RepID=UPI0013584E06|nr:MFS transporter [Roseomonas sp. 18066]